MKVLQTMTQVKNLEISNYDFYYTVIENRDEKKVVNEENDNNENDYLGKINNNEMLK